MHHFLLFILPFTIVSCATSINIRVMTFNIWLSGAEVKDGIHKIAKHIALVDPDIVSLQEVKTQEVAKTIADLLPGQWSIAFKDEEHPDTAVLTKHKISIPSFSSTNRSNHVLIELSDEVNVNFWAVHADYKAYGPYAAYNKLVTKPEQIMAGENPKKRNGRANNMFEIVTSPAMQSALKSLDTIPVIVAGDFNSPSHQDWIEQTRNMHGNWTFEWPATKILEEKLELKDSFRYLHADVITDPGFTWSTCNKYNAEWEYQIDEPQDRIDFIFYRGPIVPITSRVYSGKDPITPIPNQWNNDWPSDHAAVVTDFKFDL